MPLLDLVADVRASTPTDAAKRVVPDVAEETQRISQLRSRGRQAVHAGLERESAGLRAVRSRPSLADPYAMVTRREEQLAALVHAARRCLQHALDRAQDDLRHSQARVRALSPAATLDRGYAIVQHADGHVVRSVRDVSTGEVLSIRLSDGRLAATAGEPEADATGA
jgi:exodeoxyribonuclease VII large subunit